MNYSVTYMDDICMRPPRTSSRPDMGLPRRSSGTFETCTAASSGRPPRRSATESTEHGHSDRLSHHLAGGRHKQTDRRHVRFPVHRNTRLSTTKFTGILL